MKKTSCWAFGVVLLMCGWGNDGAVAQQGVEPRGDSQAVHSIGETSLVIHPGDVITVVVFDTPELSGTFRIEPNGYTNVPLLGRINLAGATLSEAAEKIRTSLISEQLMKDPLVTVSLTDLSEHAASILGEVAKPGPVPVGGELHLWDVVAGAGGALSTAGSHVLIVHRSGNPSEVFQIHWDQPLANQPNPLVSEGDTVQILASGYAYAVGQVLKSGPIPITNEHMYLSQLISNAGGFSSTAKSRHARLVNVFDRQKPAREIDLLAVLDGKADDVEIKNGDLLYVPDSAIKAVIQRGLTSAISIASALIIYSQQK